MGRKPILPQGANAFTAGAQLRQQRLKNGISLQEMAERLTYSKGYLSAVENGKERVHKELVERYETALGLEEGELSGLLQVHRSTSLADAITYLVKNASIWSSTIQKLLLRREMSKFFEEKDWQHHLELALQNAAEQGLAEFQTIEERDHYRNLLGVLSEPGSHSDEFRFEVLYQFIYSNAPNLDELNISCNRLLNLHAQTQPITEVDMEPYLISFIKALIAQVYVDPLFGLYMRKSLSEHLFIHAHRKPTDIIITLNQVYDNLPNHYTPEQFGRDVAIYAHHVEKRLHHLKLVGIVPKDKNSDPELNGAFVPLRITFPDQSSLETDSNDSLVALLEQHSYIVLLGGPGSGKSTSARHLAWSHALANLPNLFDASVPILPGNPLPLHIELRPFSEVRRYHPEYDFLSYTTEVLLGHEEVKINTQMFRTLLERGAILLIFDGLDEVATLDERKQLVQEIESFALTYPGNRVLVTSRPVGYELAPCSRQQFIHAQVQNFNGKQIEQFLQNWYTYVLKLPFISQDDQKELDDLSETLRNDQRLRKLAENPLLLTVITALHRYERLPDKRVHVYDRCADLLLDTWARLRGTDARWKNLKMTKDDQYACVAYLGYVLHEQSQEKYNEATTNNENSLEERISDVPTPFLLKEIERFLEERKRITEVDERHAEAKRFLDLMQEEAGLIVVPGTDKRGDPLYSFVHRTFQEYFAAAYIYEQFQQEVNISIVHNFLEEHLHDPHWHEVILLLLGNLKDKPVTNLLQSILRGKIKSRRSLYRDVLKQDLFFVSSCLIEEIAVQPEQVKEVILQLIDLVKNAPFPLQRTEALEKLYSLIQTRQYSSLTRQELVAFIEQRPILDANIEFRIAHILLQNNIPSKESQLVALLLEHLAQHPDLLLPLALRRMLLESFRWLKESRSSIQLLRLFVQCSNLSVSQSIEVARELYQLSPKESQEKQEASQLLIQLLQRPDLPIEHAIQSIVGLYRNSPAASQEKQPFDQFLVQLAKRLDLSSVKQVILSIESQQQAATGLSANILIRRSYSESRQLVNDLLVIFAKHSDLAFEQVVQDVQAFYQDHSRLPIGRSLIASMLVCFSHRPDVSIEQAIQVAQLLHQPILEVSRERQEANRLLVQLAQRPDLTVEQAIWIAQKLALDSVFTKYPRESSISERVIIAEMLEAFARFSELSASQAIQVAQLLLKFRADRSALDLSVSLLLHIARNQALTFEQRLEAVTALFTIRGITWSEVVQAVRIVPGLLNEEEARKYFNEHWPMNERWPTSPKEEVILSDAPFLAELAQQELLPAWALNRVYSTLRRLVPKFDGFAQ